MNRIPSSDAAPTTAPAVPTVIDSAVGNDTGSVEISLREHCTAFSSVFSMVGVLWGLAAKKGCPVSGVIEPTAHPEFKYRVIRDHEEKITIEWRRLHV
jgi:hypothetical protein